MFVSNPMISPVTARIWFYVVAVAYGIWAIYSVSVHSESRTPFFLILTSIFFFLYLLPITVFQARLEHKPDGLHVLQYRSVVIPYDDLKCCVGFFLFPFSMVVVDTNRKLPLEILLSGDDFERIRMRFFRDGKLATAIKARMCVEIAKPGIKMT